MVLVGALQQGKIGHGGADGDAERAWPYARQPGCAPQLEKGKTLKAKGRIKDDGGRMKMNKSIILHLNG